MTQGRPTAAPAHFPYDHPSMAVVMAEEAHDAFLRRPRTRRFANLADYTRERWSVAG